jgi:hypothetical protein
VIRAATGHRWPLLLAVLASALALAGAAPGAAHAAANLTLTVTDTPDPAVPSDTLTLTATVKNEGDAIAYDPTLNFGAPTNASVRTSGCFEFIGVLSCLLGTSQTPDGDREFPPGATSTFTVTYDQLEVGDVEIQVHVSHNEINTDPGPNGLLSVTKVEPRADLKIDLSANTPVTIGNTSTVTASVFNSLAGVARNAQVQFAIPAELPVAALPDGCVAPSALRVTCALGDVVSQQTVTRAITLRIPTEGSFIVIGTVAWAKADPTPVDAQFQITLTGLSPIEPPDPGGPPTPPAEKPVLPKPQRVSIGLIAKGVPSGKRCLRRRTLRFRLRNPSGIPLTQADIYIGTRRVKRLTGAALKKQVVLTKLPRGSYTVIVVASVRDGGRLSGRRKLRTCR